MATRSEVLRFPRPGLPVVCVTLRPIFKSKLKHPMLEDGTVISNIEDLDVHIWRRRNARDCKLLANALGARLSALFVKQSDRLISTRVPALIPPLSIERLPISDMLIDTLRRAGITESAQLSEMSIADLMKAPTMGARRVLELVAVLDVLNGTQEAPPAPTPQRINVQGAPEDLRILNEIVQLLGNEDIDARDIRFGSLIIALRTEKDSLKAALKTLVGGISTLSGVDPWPGMRENLNAVHAKLTQVRAFNLPEDLQDILTAIATPRKAQLIARRLGWADGVERTLQTVGEEAGLTRERIRQLEARAQEKLANRTVYAPALAAALALARKMAPCTGADFSTRLTAERLANSVWSPGLLVRAAGYLGIAHSLSLHQWEDKEYLAVEPFTPQVFARVRRLSWEAARTEGAAHLPKIAFALSEELERRVSGTEIRALVTSLADLRWIDEAAGWYWLGDDGHTSIFNTIRKLLSVARRLPIDDLYEGLIKSYRMDDAVVAPKPVILRMLAQVPWLRIRQISHVEAEPPISSDEVLGDIEKIMVGVLRDEGGALDHYDFRRRCQALGVSPSTFNVYEGNSALFVRVSHGIWGLRGVDVDAEKLVLISRKMNERQLRLSMEASERALGRIPTTAFSKAGYIRLYQVTASTFRHHVMTLARTARVPEGTRFKVILDTVHLGEVVLTQDRRLRGLLPLLRHAGVQIGRKFLAHFDLISNTLQLTQLKDAAQSAETSSA